jgi:uncharacterized ParB-like nuclease family protein
MSSDVDKIMKASLAEIQSRLARYDAMQDVVAAAKLMPRETPAPGACCTVHDFKIDAGTVWNLDIALRKLEALD